LSNPPCGAGAGSLSRPGAGTGSLGRPGAGTGSLGRPRDSDILSRIRAKDITQLVPQSGDLVLYCVDSLVRRNNGVLANLPRPVYNLVQRRVTRTGGEPA
jgi:hypothetical protein